MIRKLAVLVLLISIFMAGCSENAHVSKPESTPEETVTPVADTTPVTESSGEGSQKAAESAAQQVKTPVKVVDDFGYEVTLNEIPQRIVSLAPSNTEILFAIGAGDRVVGVTDYCNYPPEAMEKPKVGGYSTIDIEKVIALNPDLVVAAYGNGAETVEILRNNGITVIALNPKNLNDIMRDIELLGKVTGCEENASKLVRMMECTIEEVKKSVANVTDRPKVAHILWHDPIWISGNNTFVDELIRLAGGENAFSDMDGWKAVSIEDMLERNPDVIIVNSGTGMGGAGKDILYEWAINELKDTSAVKTGRVYVIDADIISRPSYRLVYALEDIVSFLHPGITIKACGEFAAKSTS
jgi:iron complex transport system substrate-binding protein